MPKISIIVTVYNIEKYLPRFFESLKNQTFKDYQVLIFDDGSEDGSFDVCKRFAEQDKRIIVRHLEHVGISAARNYSMQFIDTEYAVHADGDDYVEPNYLKHLYDAVKKYNADWAISRVAYKSENSERINGEFPKYGEQFITKNEFDKWLPRLFEDRRFNYLYGKIYRSEFFKQITVEADVKQGSDTMINCEYIGKIDNLVLTDDLDYNYIKYTTRSVTSYAGKESFARLLRINNYIYNSMKAQGLLTFDMQATVYKRILLGAVWVIDNIKISAFDFNEKAKQIDGIIHCKDYLTAFSWIKKNCIKTNFDVIVPQSGEKVLKDYYKAEAKLKRKAKILSVCPPFIRIIYHRLKGTNAE